MNTCKNCGSELTGPYCSACGQKDNNGRVILRDTIREVSRQVFDDKAPLLRTIKELFIRPAQMIQDYIQGKRKAYTSPVRYFLLILAVYLILKSLLSFNPVETFSLAAGQEYMPSPDSVTDKASAFFAEYINIFLIIFAFTLSAFSRLFFRSSGTNFAEYLSLSFYVISQYIFISLFVILGTIWSPKVFLLNYLIVLFYPMVVLYSFHEGNRVLIFLKALFTVVPAWVLYTFISYFISVLIVITFGL